LNNANIYIYSRDESVSISTSDGDIVERGEEIVVDETYEISIDSAFIIVVLPIMD